MATIHLILGIICFAFNGSPAELNRDFLTHYPTAEVSTKGLGASLKGVGFRGKRVGFSHVGSRAKLQTANHQLQTVNWSLSTEKAQKILFIARAQIGVREATGKNDGTAVEAYLSYTGNKKGEPWCASFVSWVFGVAGYQQPRTAWSPALFPAKRSIETPVPAAVFGIYFKNVKRIAHCGLIEKVKGNWVTTIEGNTNLVGSREGDGVYRKLRHQRSIAVYANWLSNSSK